LKIAAIVVCILMGLLFLFASVTVLFHLIPKPELTGTARLFNEGIEATGYFMPTLKIVELTCAICFLINRFVALATVVLFPITLNILLFHTFVDTTGLPVGIFVFAANLFLAYYYRKHYESILVAK
jgi:putative oxidoreductase